MTTMKLAPEPKQLAGLGSVLAGWVLRQRWFLGSDRAPTPLGFTPLASPRAEVELGLWFFGPAVGPGPTYQVPVTARREPLPSLDNGLISQLTDEYGPLWIYDGPHDPSYAQWVWQKLAADLPAADLVLRHHRVLMGEQSNSSMILHLTAPDTPHQAAAQHLIVKVFRVLQPGANPDAIVPAALNRQESRLVPKFLGALWGQWPGAEARSTGLESVQRGHLASAQEFIADSPDAWRVARQAVHQGLSFTAQSQALGQSIAQLHRDLQAAFPEQQECTGSELAEQFLARLTSALDEVPALQADRSHLRAVLQSVDQLGSLKLQRIHGDLHLGQILDGQERGWLIIDFEGEPLRPISQRSAPDLALRDVAGMLRSFDYAGADAPVVARQTKWVEQCRTAFCRGYAEVSGQDPQQQSLLLQALELDKALYEARYEAAHRPEWLPIPLAGIDRILAEHELGTAHQPEVRHAP